MISLKDLFEEVDQDLDPGLFYLGKVIENKDPKEGYALQVKIYPFFSGVDDSDLPWANPLSIDEDHIKAAPCIGDWVWCTFRGDPMSPYWISKKLVSDAGQHSVLTKMLNLQLQLNGLKQVQFPDFDLIRCGKAVIVLNKEGEGSLFIEDSLVSISFNEDGLRLKAGQNEVVVSKASLIGAKIELGAGGNINITPALGQSISLNNGVMPCNDFPVCLFSGAPHALDPLKSVKVP